MSFHTHVAGTLHFELFDVLSILLVLLNTIVAAVRSDNTPDWAGWDFIELAFACIFTIDMCTRWMLTDGWSHKVVEPQPLSSTTSVGSHQSLLSGRTSSMTKTPSLISRLGRSRLILKTYNYLSVNVNVLDTIATLLGWFEVAFTFLRQDDTSVNLFWIHWMRWVRVLRLLRLVVRVGRTAMYLRDLAALLKGVAAGVRLACWGLLTLALITLLWAIFLRSVAEEDRGNKHQQLLKETLPNLPRSMHLVFRCMVIKSDRSCSVGSYSFIELVSGGWLFETLWSLTEFFYHVCSPQRSLSHLCFAGGRKRETRAGHCRSLAR